MAEWIGPERQICGVEPVFGETVEVTDYYTKSGHFRRIGNGPIELVSIGCHTLLGFVDVFPWPRI